MQTIDFETARRNMVEYQIRCCKVLDPVVLETIETMPREDFVPENVKSIAYMEGRVPLPCGQEMLSPLQEAHILQALELSGEERILEVGTGVGFLTAMMAMHAKEVMSYELHEELAQMARANLAAHGINNAKVIHGNAMLAQTPGNAGDFDAIVLAAALEEVPEHVYDHLKPEGRIIAFLGHNPVVCLERHDRVGNSWRRTVLMDTLLKDMEGLPERREFVF